MLIGEAFYRGQLIVCNGESQSGWYDDLDWIFRHKDQVCMHPKSRHLMILTRPTTVTMKVTTRNRMRKLSGWKK